MRSGQIEPPPSCPQIEPPPSLQIPALFRLSGCTNDKAIIPFFLFFFCFRLCINSSVIHLIPRKVENSYIVIYALELLLVMIFLH